MEVEARRNWSTSTSDSEKEEPLLVRSSKKLEVADHKIEEPPVYEENNNETLYFNGLGKLQLPPEKLDEIVLISAVTNKTLVFDNEKGHNDVQDLIFEKSYGDEVFSPITKELDTQKSPFDEIKHHHEENKDGSSASEILFQPSEESSNGSIPEESSPEITALNDEVNILNEVNLLNEFDYEETEYDVERVLKNQNTHDLFCPNCRSCITKRVILCKRKRTVITPKDAKRNKFDTEDDLNVDPIGNEGGEALNTVHDGGSASADNGEDKDPEVFRCLSCFTFFIPSGKGVWRFWRQPSGEKTETKSIEKSDIISAPKKHWWPFKFNFDKEKISETGHGRDLQIDDIGAPLLFSSPCDSSSTPANAEIKKTELDSGKVGEVVNVGEKPDGVIDNVRGNAEIKKTELDNGKVGEVVYVGEEPDGVIDNVRGILSRDYPLIQSDSKSDIVTHTGYPNENVVAKQQEDGLKIVITECRNTYLVLEAKKDNHEEEKIFGDLPSKKKQVEFSYDNGSIVEDEDPLNKNDTNILPSGVVWPPVIGTKVDIHIEKPLTDDAGGSDTIIIIKDQPTEHIIPPSSQDVIDVATIGVAHQTRRTGGINGVEIVKSMVYGGLIESITSLGILSSAAGADATTLNIVALSLANLIGGLFLIIHNIWDLRDDHDANTSRSRKDRYQEILGRRQDFRIHATIAILSFIVFGLVPPVIYGLSFRETNDRDFKLITVAVGSLLCISLLAIGNAYVQKLSAKGYVKTLVYYVTSGFMASGITFVAGKFIKNMMVELGWFESTQALNLPAIAQILPSETPWKSF